MLEGTMQEDSLLYYKCSAYDCVAYGCPVYGCAAYGCAAYRSSAYGCFSWCNCTDLLRLDIIMRKQQGISKIKDDVGEKGIESDENWT